MKNSRGDAKTTYGRMKKREDKAMDTWSKKATPGKADPKAKGIYKEYTSAAKKRAQAGAAMKKKK
jgi:hypothetical protein